MTFLGIVLPSLLVALAVTSTAGRSAFWASIPLALAGVMLLVGHRLPKVME